MDLILPAIAATTGESKPADGAKPADTAKPADGADAKAADPAATESEEVRAQLRRLVKVSEFDLKPAFLYFHYPHEDDDKKLTPDGRTSKRQCEIMADEQVARWAMLFRCFEVEMGRSDRSTAGRLGAVQGTCYAVVGGKVNVIGKSGPFANAKTAAAFLRDTLKTASPDLWAEVQRRVEEQKVVLAEARKHMEKREWKAAVEKYDLIVKSDLRIGDFWDDAAKEWQRATEKAASDR